MCTRFNIKYRNVFDNKSEVDGDKYLRFKGKVIENSYLEKIDKCIQISYENLRVKNPQSHLLYEF